jgi:hypothetical protein
VEHETTSVMLSTTVTVVHKLDTENVGVVVVVSSEQGIVSVKVSSIVV